MNNWIAGVGGAVAAVVITGSALVYANRPADGEQAGSGSRAVATRTVCTDEKTVTKKEWGANSVVGTVLGGAAGGVLGHQIGGGKGKDVATAVGAVGGAYAGHEIANSKYPDKEVSHRQTCREVPVES